MARASFFDALALAQELYAKERGKEHSADIAVGSLYRASGLAVTEQLSRDNPIIDAVMRFDESPGRMIANFERAWERYEALLVAKAA